jgi:hypothetical protein
MEESKLTKTENSEAGDMNGTFRKEFFRQANYSIPHIT